MMLPEMRINEEIIIEINESYRFITI